MTPAEVPDVAALWRMSAEPDCAQRLVGRRIKVFRRTDGFQMGW